MLRVLLLTFKDSSNLGDAVIEACSRNLLKAVLGQLGVAEYVLESQDLSYNNDADIASFDLIVFGGGGLVKYKYQDFHEQIPYFVAIAQTHGIPVVFSGVGVEGFDPADPRCLELQKALKSPCVVQITTRDDIESLGRYMTDEAIPIAKVLDPAVLSGRVFNKKRAKTAQRIGLNVVRGGLFQANGKPWEEDDEVEFWKDVALILEGKGYPYAFFTNGLFSDEVFIQRLENELSLSNDQAILDVNDQDMLLDTLGSFKGVIAFRLHASVISYSLGIPSVGLAWNEKVSFFYENIHYPERALPFADWKAETVVEALEAALNEGVDDRGGPSPSLADTFEWLYRGVDRGLQVLAQEGRLDWSRPQGGKADYAQALDSLTGAEKRLTPEGRYERAVMKIDDMRIHYYGKQQALQERDRTIRRLDKAKQKAADKARRLAKKNRRIKAKNKALDEKIRELKEEGPTLGRIRRGLD